MIGEATRQQKDSLSRRQVEHTPYNEHSPTRGILPSDSNMAKQWNLMNWAVIIVPSWRENNWLCICLYNHCRHRLYSLLPTILGTFLKPCLWEVWLSVQSSSSKRGCMVKWKWSTLVNTWHDIFKRSINNWSNNNYIKYHPRLSCLMLKLYLY